MKKIIKNISDLGSWLLRWIPIILVIGVFLVCSLMIGGLIGNRPWIVFVADVAFYYMFWLLLKLCVLRRTRKHYYKCVGIMGIVLAVMFILIIMATIGVGITTSSWVIVNVYVFPIGFIITLGIFRYHYDKRKSLESS